MHLKNGKGGFELEDSKLIEIFLNSNPEQMNKAFGELFDKYYTEALKVAYLITGNMCDSENIVQDSFITCYGKLAKLKNPGKFKYWFFHILTRNAWRYCNKQKREQPVEEVFDDLAISNDKSAFEILAAKETSWEIKRAIEKLDTKQKTVIILYYYNEFSVSEIAEIMKCSQGTIKSRLYNSRKKLKQLISNYERSFENE